MSNPAPLRNHKATPKRRKLVCRLLKAGNFLTVACRAAGITTDTHHNWMRKGAVAPKGDPYRLYRKAVNRALVLAEALSLAKVKLAEKDDWRAAMEFMARRFPERWSPQSRVALDAKVRVKDSGRRGTIIDALLDDPEIREVCLEAYRASIVKEEAKKS